MLARSWKASSTLAIFLGRSAALLLLLAAIAPSAALAQSTVGGIIRGQIVDPQGVPLPGVTVTAKDSRGADAGNTVSDGEGKYQLLGMPPGLAHTITADLPGFAAFERSGIEVSDGESVAIDIQFKLATLTESITVLGDEITRSRVTIERVQDVPLSISIVSGKELEQLEATDISALTQRAANISYNYGNQRTSSLSIRGIGKQGQTEAQDPSVGVIVDGVNYAYNALTSSFDFTDVETVEVTRGPQGTLLGKNTSLGVLNVTTKKPSFTPGGEATLTFGQYGAVTSRVAVGGPITEKVAWRGTFSVSKIPGDMKNVYNRDITYTNRDRVSGRVQFLVVPSPKFSARFAADFQPRGGETTNGRTIETPTPKAYANGTPTNLSTDASTRLARPWFTQQGSYSYEKDFLYGGGQYSVNNDNQRPLVTGSNGGTMELNWFLGPHSLTSISAYKDYHFNATNDDRTPFDIYRNSGGFWNDYQQISQEVRFASRIGTLADFQAGLFFIRVLNSVDYRREWGNDAGAWFANPTQYARLDADSAGRYLMQNSLDRLSMSYNSPAGIQQITNKSGAPFAQANWRLLPSFTLTTGVRFTWENRRNVASTLIKDFGFGPELNPVSVNGVQLGGFASSSAGTLLPANAIEQLSLADRVANKYFGATIGGLPGETYNSLPAAQKQQVADAKAIRVSQIGVLFNETTAEPFEAVQPSFVISPVYKINPDMTAYLSWQYGEKAGIAQFTNGVSSLAGGEKSSAYEIGVKSVLFNRKLVLNTDVFLTDIKDYQQSIRVLDVYTTNLNNDGLLYYTSATGNVPKVRAKGLEVDGVFAPFGGTTFRFAGAFNDARYKYFPNAAQPVENGYAGAPPYRDVSGQHLPGSAKWAFNLGTDYRRRVSEDHEIYTSFNTSFTSRYKSDNSLSDYSWIPGHFTTDLAVGFGKRGQRFDVSFLVKNLFNDRTPQTQSWNSYTPAYSRWFGVQLTGKVF